MASKQPVWGIDVGQCSLKAIKLQAAGDKVELLGFDFIEHEQNLSQAEADATEIARKAIETFASRNDLANCRVVVSVPGQQTLTRFTKMPPVDAKKIPDMVQYEASQQIPFDMDEVVWDYQVFTEGEAAEVEVGIFAIRKELIRNYLSLFTSQKVEPMMVQTSPMASYNSAQFELSLPAGETCILLDMGALATDLIVMEGKRIWARPVPIGGNRFTEALVSAFKVPFAKAEKLKRSAATSKYARQIFQAMRPVFADLVSEVQRSIGYYTSTHRDSHITRIVGMGNAFRLPGLQKFLQQNVQMKVDKFPGFEKLVEVTTAKKAEYDENQMSLGVAYGLALQGLDMATVNSNLLPIEVRRTLLWRKKQPWFMASAACLALSAGSIWVGNVMAGGQIAGALGGASIENLRPQTYNSVDAAESALRSAPSVPPIQRAMQVAGAAKCLKSEFGKYTAAGKDAGTLGTLSKFPQNNVYVPMILDVIHRAFKEASSPDLKSVKSPADYLRMASRIQRSDRKEMWIDELRMDYSQDPGLYFSKNPDEQVKRGRPGWAVQITGTTTEANPATWIEENLKRALLELGSEPGKGIYFDTVTIAKVTAKGRKTKSSSSGFGGGQSDDDNSKDRRAGGRRTSGGRDESRGGGGRRVTGGGPDFSSGGGSPAPTPPKSGGSGSIKDELRKLAEDMLFKDPLTRESTERDYEFTLEIAIRKEEVPKDRIPERFQPKKAEPNNPATPAKP